MKKFPYVQSFNGYHYIRFKGQRVRFEGAFGSEAFRAAYRVALAEAQTKARERERVPSGWTAKNPVAAGTLRANVNRYLRSALFKTLEPSTQEMRRRVLNRWCDGSKQLPGYGDLPLAEITPAAFAKMMYAREHTPGAQRGFLAAVRHFLKDCKKAQTVLGDFDPTRDQHCGRGQNPEGLKCWPEALVKAYRDYWPRGTKQRLAIELLYETGASCVDVVKLGRDSVVAGALIVFDRQKTGTPSFRPFTPALERELAAYPIVVISGPWLRTENGLPYTARYFGQQFREWATEAGIPKGFTAHGIRKRAATDDAESGATATELMAMYGWRDIKQAAHYTAAADMRRIALTRAEKIRTRTNAV